MNPRILVTGSRTWDDVDKIRIALETIREQEFFADAILVHGAAKGADRIASDQWKALGGTTEPHPALWNRCVPECMHGPRPRRGGYSWCPSAGIRRNRHMVQLGADICLAFQRNASTGTQSCIDFARRAGIHTLVFDYDSVEVS